MQTLSSLHRGSIAAVVAFSAATLFAQPPAENPDLPRVAVCLPLGVEPGQTVQVTLRGQKLDTATEVRPAAAGVAAKIISQAKIEVPQRQNPLRVGDTQLVVELSLPADLPTGKLEFTVVGPAGESAKHALLIDAPGSVAAEAEPNDGLGQPQPLELGRELAGSIQQPQDVDVFAVRGPPGTRVVVEVFAARHGSAVDAILTAFDSRGRILAACDDLPDTSDARIEATLPADGLLLVSLQDAHDQGGPAHVYRLVARMIE